MSCYFFRIHHYALVWCQNKVVSSSNNKMWHFTHFFSVSSRSNQNMSNVYVGSAQLNSRQCVLECVLTTSCLKFKGQLRRRTFWWKKSYFPNGFLFWIFMNILCKYSICIYIVHRCFGIFSLILIISSGAHKFAFFVKHQKDSSKSICYEPIIHHACSSVCCEYSVNIAENKKHNKKFNSEKEMKRGNKKKRDMFYLLLLDQR